MYSLAKLLSDEPAKLESLILATLKLLATIWIANVFLGFETNLSEFSIESFFRNFRVDESIYFVLNAIGIWYLLWEVVMDLIVESAIKLVSLLGKSEETFKWYLRLTNSIIIEDNKIVNTKPNILLFIEAVNDEKNDYPFIIETRANQIFSVGLVAFIVLLTSELELSNWQIGIGAFIILNFFTISVLQRKLHDYYIENVDYVRSRSYQLGQIQKLKNAIRQNPDLNTKFDLIIQNDMIVLKSKENNNDFPTEITILPLFAYNKEFGALYFGDLESEVLKKMGSNDLSIICSNFYSPNKLVSKIQNTIYCIHAESQGEMYNGLEQLFFMINSKKQTLRN